MEIDKKAPMSACKETIIEAPIEKVWQTLTGINLWPEWQPDVTSAKLEGELQPGSNFYWKAKGLNISSTLQEVETNRRIGWTGNSPGMKAVHIWSMQPHTDGTLVTTEESLSGWLAGLLKLFDPKFLDKSLAGSLNVLKKQVE